MASHSTRPKSPNGWRTFLNSVIRWWQNECGDDACNNRTFRWNYNFKFGIGSTFFLYFRMEKTKRKLKF